MHDVALKIYPSGFIGSDQVQTTQSLDLTRLKDQLFNLSAISNPDNHTGNLDITALWESVISGTPEHATFAFKERILQCAGTAFGRATVYGWIAAQKQSPYFGEYHSLWLDETLQFVLSGTPRNHSVHNWKVLLRLKDSEPTSTDSSVVNYYLKGIGQAPQKSTALQFNSFDEAPLVTKLTTATPFDVFVKAWCARKGGIDDLMSSLFLLFGKH
jgi:hypothetical protein